MYLITRWFGTFLFDKNGVQKQIIFPNNAQEIKERMMKIDNNCILEEEKHILTNIKQVKVSEKRLQKIGDFDSTDPFFNTIVIKPEDFGFTWTLLHEVTVSLAHEKIQEKLKSPDLQIGQMVNAMDDLLQTSNLISERLNQWILLQIPKEKMKPFQKTLLVIKQELKRLEQQIEDDMKTIAPNLSEVGGPLIGARLIAIAGGIDRLASMSASTIQILGAEKALFRYKKEGGKPPKHGVIFQHPLINKASKKDRGRIARLLATKITIAVKADVFTKRYIAKELRDEIKQRMLEIRKQ